MIIKSADDHFMVFSKPLMLAVKIFVATIFLAPEAFFRLILLA